MRQIVPVEDVGLYHLSLGVDVKRREICDHLHAHNGHALLLAEHLEDKAVGPLKFLQVEFLVKDMGPDKTPYMRVGLMTAMYIQCVCVHVCAREGGRLLDARAIPMAGPFPDPYACSWTLHITLPSGRTGAQYALPEGSLSLIHISEPRD